MKLIRGQQAPENVVGLRILLLADQVPGAPERWRKAAGGACRCLAAAAVRCGFGRRRTVGSVWRSLGWVLRRAGAESEHEEVQEDSHPRSPPPKAAMAIVATRPLASS
jgi:hypothetical protein